MAARVELDELNGGGVTTHGVVNLNVGAVDQANIVVSPSTAINRGENAYIKYNSLHFIDLVDAQAVHTIRIWMSGGSFRNGESIKSNLWKFGLTNYVPGVFTTPTRNTLHPNDIGNIYSIPTTEPLNNVQENGVFLPLHNLGINHSLSGTLTAPGSSDIWVWQLQTTSITPNGALATKEFTLKWEEDLT